MSALAQYLAFGSSRTLESSRVSGSDRSFDQGRETSKRDYFRGLGIKLFPQDGEGITAETSCLVVSTAIEDSSPEIARARELGVPVVHRSDLLAFLADTKKTIAVAGTSGKSTVTALIYHILVAGGLKPSLITGAGLVSLQRMGMLGNAAAGDGEWLAIEADESDGSLIKYHPEIGLILNIEKDHQPVAELMPLFSRFKSQVRSRTVLNSDDAHCRSLLGPTDAVFSGSGVGELGVEDLHLEQWSTSFRLGGVSFTVAVPGRHNLANALAALAVGLQLGIPLEKCARGIADYRGIERRFQLVGKCRGITVVDDFAHNPSKVAACIETVRRALDLEGSAEDGRGRLLAVFHPHGFAPMKLMREEFVSAFAAGLGKEDKLYMPEIYYAGGTAERSISSQDIIADVNTLNPVGEFHASKEAAAQAMALEARPGDWLVSMGARDPSLGAFAQGLFRAVEARQGPKP